MKDAATSAPLPIQGAAPSAPLPIQDAAPAPLPMQDAAPFAHHGHFFRGQQTDNDSPTPNDGPPTFNTTPCSTTSCSAHGCTGRSPPSAATVNSLPATQPANDQLTQNDATTTTWQSHSNKKRKRIRSWKRSNGPTKAVALHVIFANVSFLGDKALRFFTLGRKDHIIGIAESHLRGEAAERAKDRLQTAGWTTSYSPATPSPNSEHGNQGGVFLGHKKWLQTATPSIATGNEGHIFPEGDVVWKIRRVQGMHIVIAFAYFDHSIGMTGANLSKFQTICQIRDRGKRKLIVAADFNMTPQRMQESGLLEEAGLTIITAGDDSTCKTSTGWSQIDYLLVDTNIVSLISEVKLVMDKPWNTHAGIEFDINCRPATISTTQLVKPKPIPYATDDKGNYQPWHIEEEDWQAALHSAEPAAEHCIDETKIDDDNESWNHAEQLGITEQARAFAVRFATWSKAAEEAALAANPPEKDPHKHKGRGLMPKFAVRSLADKSSHKYTEHLMWELAAKDATIGPDLYSTLWYTIASIMEAAAFAQQLDSPNTQYHTHDFHENEHLYHDSDRTYDTDANDHHASPPTTTPT